MLIFILGRQPEIGLAELRAVFGRKVSLISREVATANLPLSTAQKEFSRLGSVVKIAEVFAQIPDFSSVNLANAIRENFAKTEGKITLGVSLYGEKLNVRETTKLSLEIKRILSRNHSVRLVLNDAPALSSAAVLHNKLAGENPKKRELIFARISRNDDEIRQNTVLLANTIFVQNIESYTFRDRSRPKRDARVGMLPPKLAQTMINLARGAGENSRKNNASRQLILDPFCGTGVVLQEATLMNFAICGTDLEPRMIDFSLVNLAWLKQKFQLDFREKLAVGDATRFDWRKFLSENSRNDYSLDSPTKSANGAGADSRKNSQNNPEIDFVVTETYLGRAYTTSPNPENLRENIANCDKIIREFLKNLAPQISRKTGLCVAVPCWFANGKILHLPIIAKLTALGYEQIFYSNVRENLIYHREDQIVGRELLVLRKKS